MTQHMPPQALSLFDLLARTWDLDQNIRQVLFNMDGTALAVVQADGRMTFIGVKDAEGPEKRIRQELDTGRMTIRAREKPLPMPLTSRDATALSDSKICPLGGQGFAFVHSEGEELWRATPRGQLLRLLPSEGTDITALSALPGAARIVVGRGDQISVVSAEGGEPLSSTELTHDVRDIAVSDDGGLLACWGAGHISLIKTDGLELGTTLPCQGQVLAMRWSPCARWLIAGCRDKSVLVVDAAAGTADRIVDFPQAVQSVDFSATSRAMVASGAFRVVGWALPELPFGDHEGDPITTGKPGLTIVDRLSVHGKRDLCAVVYSNGLVTICRVGQPEEMMLREGTGVAVTSVAWSGTGTHLALGTEDGTVSIVTFPDDMFKQ
ncbi:hypothetical protein [Celeribacter baekdonensis]|uniref:WD40 repeat domain-containing protein n=1 Tax=Celeribacter baekdonensis TaxID=875171 RepID=UPI0030D8A815|tara:strand:- start:198799 stop:199938 length:1140 start_codon:yes stop_codon:yes gene_type:complete